MVQEHHARSHHFDFRLEMDGTLKSWAVPKGPSMDPEVKRLAVEVEDHPIDYASFAGEIPKGHYGAGKVEIWDHGTWEPTERAWKKGFAAGKLKFRLKGEKLHGDFVLARMHVEGRQPNWLLRKIEHDSTPGVEEPAAKPLPETGPRGTLAAFLKGLGKLPPRNSAFLPPQLAKAGQQVPKGDDWLHEIKFDGYRMITVKQGSEVRLFTRNRLDWTERFGSLAADLAKLSKNEFTLDGEIVVFDEKRRSSFGALQQALKSGEDAAFVFVAFDLPDIAGHDLRQLPLHQRKQALRLLIPADNKRILFSDHRAGEAAGKDLFKHSCRLGWEGIISKPADGTYRSDSRDGWWKTKCVARNEFVICGYTPPKGSCPAFGALVLGSYENGKLVHRGKVGTGFTDERREELLALLKRRTAKKAPFETDADTRDVIWVKPGLVAEVKFAELTSDGLIRQGSFLGLREDKPAADVHLDEPPSKPVKTTAKKAGSRSKKGAEDSSIISGITITHPDRILYPDTAITKLDFARHYEQRAKLLLPHVVNRPLAFLRAPSGIEGEQFFQKHFSTGLPPHVFEKTVGRGEDAIKVCYLKNAAGLVALVQFGVVEIHPWGSSLAHPENPDTLIWDLDPHESVPWQEVLGTAFLIRDLLADWGLKSVVKTSGGKGLHVMVHCKPLRPWAMIRPFTKLVAERVAEMNPKRLTTAASKARRTGKIYIDWLRNGRGATCVAAWCCRARAGAPVSVPLDWDDLPDATAAGITLRDVLPPEPHDWIEARRSPVAIPLKLLKELGIPTV